MSAIPTSIPITPSLTETATACPLHIAMREIAHLAVTQHVLYLEGECLPRPAISRELEIWSSLYALVSTRLCVAARTTPLEDEENTTALKTIRARAECSDTAVTASERFQRGLEEAITRCSACARSHTCPLGDPGGFLED